MKKIHTISFNIYYEDTDSTGYTYHTSYLRIAERARTELLRNFFSDLIEKIHENFFFFVVRKIEVDFIKPSYLFDKLKIDTFYLDNKFTSLSLQHDIIKNNDLICRIFVKLVWINGKSKKPLRVPSNLISRFKSL